MTLTLLPPPAPLRERAAEAVDELLLFARRRLAKASAHSATKAREAAIADGLEAFAADVAAHFEGFAERLAGRVRKDALIDFDPDDDIDWAYERAELQAVLEAWYETLGRAAYAAVAEQLGVELRWDLGQRGAKRVMARVATRVTGITETTRDAIRGYVERAIAEGRSVDSLAKELAGVVEQWYSGRAQTIALTESGNAYAHASIEGYRDSGIVDEVEIFDGDECGWDGHDDPDLADGSIRTLDEYEQTPLSHPNCQRAAGPIVARS